MHASSLASKPGFPGVEFLAWSPLASGFLADDFDIDDLPADDLRRGLRWATPLEHERWQRILRTHRAIADRHGSTLAATALAWTTRHAGCHAIVGARTPQEAAAILDVVLLDAVDIAALDEASA